MAGYPDDVVVCDEYRVECKYRRKGAGFSRLHKQVLDNNGAIRLTKSGLYAVSFLTWIDLLFKRVDQLDAPDFTCVHEITHSRKKVILDWKGDTEFLALRRAHHPWIILFDIEKPAWSILTKAGFSGNRCNNLRYHSPAFGEIFFFKKTLETIWHP